jgi:hypothetical protein
MSNAHKGHSRAEKFAGTLHDAENKQLEQFVKNRNAELDKEIAAMKSRLGSGAMNMSINGRSLTAIGAISGSTASRVSIKDETSDTLLHQSYARSPEVDLNQAMQSSIIKKDMPQHVHGSDLHLNSQNSAHRGAHVKGDSEKSLGTFLQRIKLKMEDAMLSPAGTYLDVHKRMFDKRIKCCAYI